MPNFPKVVALDTDWTIFWGWLDQKTWGKGPHGASPLAEDNIQKINFWEIQDKSNSAYKCGMYADIPKIIGDILKNNAKLAIVSRNSSKAMCDRALSCFYVQDGHGNDKCLIDLVSFDEVYDSEKTVHFGKIQGYTGFKYTDMILYDDEAVNNKVEMLLGVTFQVSRDQKGLTWDNYQQGLEMWRRNQHMHTPFIGNDLSLYPKRKFIGYSGMDINTIKLLEAGGRRHDREEAARLGYAMYVTDDPRIANYFNNWIKTTTFGPQTETIVCAIFARDGDVFDRLPKIWFPGDDVSTMVDVTTESEFNISWKQENRDRKVASWGVQKPFVLFARHWNMGKDFPVSGRWNEMVIYGQVQEAQILTVRMLDNVLADDIKNPTKHLHYEQQIGAWNITVPAETRNDFRRNNENF